MKLAPADSSACRTHPPSFQGEFDIREMTGGWESSNATYIMWGLRKKGALWMTVGLQEDELAFLLNVNRALKGNVACGPCGQARAQTCTWERPDTLALCLLLSKTPFPEPVRLVMCEQTRRPGV